MRKSIAALAVIRARIDGTTRCLAQWNEKWQRFHFVGRHKRSEELFRECIIREVSEELGLLEGRDYVVGERPLVHWEDVASSHNAHENTAYAKKLFEVRLLNGKVQRRANLHRNRWLTESEILARQTSDGLAIRKTKATLLARTHEAKPSRPAAAILEALLHKKDLL